MSGTSRGAARAIAEQIERAQHAETVGALIAAFGLRAIRDRELFGALGAKSTSALLAARLPALDRTSARQLLAIADAFMDAEPAKLVPLGVARLLSVARAPEAERAEWLAAGAMLPSGELARQVRELTERADAICLRASMAAPSDEKPKIKVSASAPTGEATAHLDEAERIRLAQTLLADVESAYGDMNNAAFEVARLLARLRDDGHANELVRDGQHTAHLTFADCCVELFGLSALETERALALHDHLALLPLPERRRIGLRALREIAMLADPVRRDDVIKTVRGEQLSGDAAISVAREAEHAPAAPSSASVPAAAGSGWVDDPARLDPYSLLYLDDPARGEQVFADATPEALIEQILMRTTSPGDEVLDLTAGSGTVARVAAKMGRICTSIDVLDPPMLPTILVGDARSWQPETKSRYKAIFFHPPVPGEVRYSTRYAGKDQRGDLSLMDPETFGAACAEVLRHANRELLDKNGTISIIARESRAFGRFIDWPGKLSLVAEKIGMTPLDRIYAVLGPESRRALERSTGFRARRENQTIPVVTSAVIVGQEQRR